MKLTAFRGMIAHYFLLLIERSSTNSFFFVKWQKRKIYSFYGNVIIWIFSKCQSAIDWIANSKRADCKQGIKKKIIVFYAIYLCLRE